MRWPAPTRTMRQLALRLLRPFHSATVREVAHALRGQTGRLAPGGKLQAYERVAGPFRGYFVAVYAAETRPGSGRFLAFWKVCDGAAPDYWRAHCLLKGVAAGSFAHPREALLAADAAARHNIANLPTLAGLRGCSAADIFLHSDLDQLPLAVPRSRTPVRRQRPARGRRGER